MIIPLFGLGTKSKSVTVTAQTRVNVYAELSADVDKTPIAFYGTPGLRLFTSFGDTPPRGMIAVGDFFYVVHRGTFYEVNNAGVKIPRGTIGTTTGRVQMSYNGLQIGIVDGDSMYIYTIDRTAKPILSLTRVGTTATLKTTVPHGRFTGETITEAGALPAAYNVTAAVITVVDPTTLTYTMLSDPGASASPMGAYTVVSSFVRVSSELFLNPFDITWQGHVFVDCFNDSNFFQYSGIDDGTQFDGLDFSSPESDPDPIVRGVADHGELAFFGKNSTEFWTNSGNLDAVFSNQRGSEVAFGLAAPWSLVPFNDSLVGLMVAKGTSQVQVMMLKGHTPVKISSNALDKIINGYSSVADATALSYMLDGHPMVQFNFPSGGASWLFDAASNDWTKMESGLAGGRHRGEIAINYINKTLVSDYENGNIYVLDPDTYTDNGAPILRELTGRHVFQNLDMMMMDRIQLDFEVGVGLVEGQGEDPQCMLQISRDNGKTWGNEMWRTIGRIGRNKTRVFWNRLGRGYDFVFRLRVTDPVKFVLAAAAVTDEQ